MSDAPPIKPGYYTPGHAWQKLAVIAFGSLLFAFGISQMTTPLHLMFLGGRGAAEATRVIKSKPGLPDLILNDDAKIRAQQETQDHSSTFWNEFRFQDAGGREIAVRSPVGSQLKPLYPLIDDDGLPTSLPVWFDPRHPDVVAFPTIFSTWFAPGVLVVLGLVIAGIGSILLYWANRPVELPHIPSLATPQGPPPHAD